MLEQNTRILHVLAHEFWCLRHFVPGRQQKIHGVIRRQHLTWEANTCLPDGLNPLPQSLRNKPIGANSKDFTILVQAIAPGPPADLVNLCCCERSEFLSVKLLGLRKDDAPALRK